MLEYEIKANLINGGLAIAKANRSEIAFEATADRDPVLPNAAELLLTSLAACMLKNVQRYSEILNLPYRKAQIIVSGKRSDNPPRMMEISYRLEVDTVVDNRKIANWHKNILKFGTVTNTLMRSGNLKGTMVKSI